MTSRPLAALAALVLVASACTTRATTTTTVTGTPVLQAVPAPPPVNPAGKWIVALVAQGQPMEVTVDIAKLADGTLGGTITSQVFPPIPIAKATLEGKQLTLTFPVPTGETGTMSVTIDGDLMEGEWSMPGDGSKLSGKRSS